MKNPLCKYDKFVDVIDFFRNNLVLTTEKILVPFAEKCYFFAPIFNKFDFQLNFTDDAAFYFWQIFKEDRGVIGEMLRVFGKYDFYGDPDFFSQMMETETRPAYRALLFLLLSDSDSRNNFNFARSLRMNRVEVTRGIELDHSDFILHSHIGRPFVNDSQIMNEINNFKSKIVISDNQAICKFVDYKNKFDFKECFILVSTQ